MAKCNFVHVIKVLNLLEVFKATLTFQAPSMTFVSRSLASQSHDHHLIPTPAWLVYAAQGLNEFR